MIGLPYLAQTTARTGRWFCSGVLLSIPIGPQGNAQNSVESSDARVIHSTTPFSVWQPAA